MNGPAEARFRPASTSWRRVAAVGLGLPTILAVSDYWLLSAEWGGGNESAAVFFVWLVAQTAIMSYAAGTCLRSWFWRVVVLTWTSLLLNLMLFNKALIGPWGRGAFDASLLAFAFASVQFSLVAIWLVLGRARWQWRLPAALVTILPAGFMIAEFERIERWMGNTWNEVAALQVAMTALFAIALRLRGYRIDTIDDVSFSEVQARASAPSQFSLIHLLAWTTALAPVLILVQTLRAIARQVTCPARLS